MLQSEMGEGKVGAGERNERGAEEGMGKGCEKAQVSFFLCTRGYREPTA